MTLVSVVIPVYKVEEYIQRCLVSVLKQTFRNFDIILVNDQSPDASIAIAESVLNTQQEIGYQIVTRESNGGLSAARNTGLQYAHGQYVMFVDSDDYIEFDMIEKMITAATTVKSDIVICGYRHVYLDGRKEDMPLDVNEGTVSGHEALLLFLQGKYPAQIWKMLFAKHLFEKKQFPEGKIYEDVLILPFLLENAEKVTFINHILYNYLQQRKGAITRSFDIDSINLFPELQSMRDYFTKQSRGPAFMLYYNTLEYNLLSTVAVHSAQHAQTLKQCKNILKNVKSKIQVKQLFILFSHTYTNRKILGALLLLHINIWLFFSYFRRKV